MMMIMIIMMVMMVIMMTPPLSKYMFGKIIFKLKHILRMIWTFSRSWGNILDHPDTLQINCTLFISLSGHFLGHPDTFQITLMVKTPFISDRLYGYFADHLDTFHIIQTLFGLFRHFADHPETLQTNHRFSISSDFSYDHLDLFWVIFQTPRGPGRKKLSRYAKKTAFTLIRIL